MALMVCWALAGILPPRVFGAEGYVNPQLLIETQELAKRLGEAGLRLVDLRTAEEYGTGHIPGAVHLGTQALDDLKANQQGLPIPKARAEELFGGLGIGKPPAWSPTMAPRPAWRGPPFLRPGILWPRQGTGVEWGLQ
jgi:rhodanese-related sulfurtransferase